MSDILRIDALDGKNKCPACHLWACRHPDWARCQVWGCECRLGVDNPDDAA